MIDPNRLLLYKELKLKAQSGTLNPEEKRKLAFLETEISAKRTLPANAGIPLEQFLKNILGL